MAGRPGPVPGLSLMVDAAFREVVAPLFDEGQVAVVEWTVDLGFSPRQVPAWADQILSFYAEQGRLLGHGFSLSPLSGEWRPRQEAWLQALGQDVALRSYKHISEHFCFAFGGDLVEAGPLPVPMCPSTVALGRARLARLAEVAQRPIGLENLATSLSPRDALDQGEFLDRLLQPTDGFVVLDVHNLFCQAVNFELPPAQLLATYPLDRVREIHVSGGSWDPTNIAPHARPMRRDTHDDRVPEEVFELLELALDRCPNTEAVILERLPGTFRTAEDGVQFRADYARIVQRLRARERARRDAERDGEGAHA